MSSSVSRRVVVSMRAQGARRDDASDGLRHRGQGVSGVAFGRRRGVRPPTRRGRTGARVAERRQRREQKRAQSSRAENRGRSRPMRASGRARVAKRGDRPSMCLLTSRLLRSGLRAAPAAAGAPAQPRVGGPRPRRRRCRRSAALPVASGTHAPRPVRGAGDRPAPGGLRVDIGRRSLAQHPRRCGRRAPP